MNRSKNIFLTGITGGLGREILKSLLTSTQDNLFLLIRSKGRQSHWDRARKILAGNGLEHWLGTRVHVMKGDVTSEGLGLNPDDREILRNRIDEIYHIAALTALNGSKEDCFRINFEGTKEVLRVAEECWQKGKLKRFYYFSTAYVAGSLQRYHSMEEGLPENPAHANHYEASKYASECEVRKAMGKGFPATIFRPSIVVGDSKTGAVSEFNVIYPFMRLFVHGMIRKLPTRLDNSFNIVPIDFVVNAALAIAAQENSLGKTFHLVTKEPPAVGNLIRLRNEEYPEISPIEIIDPDTFKPSMLSLQEQMVYPMLKPYMGYLNDYLTFDVSNTEEFLRGTDVSFPKTDYQFLRVLVRYAIDAGYFLVG